ncbi:MAG: guanylate kinase [Desulfobacteraceae bacterium]|jgi:guanylate kinase
MPLQSDRTDPENKGKTTAKTPNMGCLFVISAPSGAGKSTLCEAVRHHFPDMLYSISRTTRSPRPGEKDGVDYIFISEDEFIQGIKANLWAEWAKVHDNYYGTSAADIDQGLAAGKDILLDIDVQGARQIVKRYPHAVTIFIMPPSLEELQRRLESRATDNTDAISKRLSNAVVEMKQRQKYHHIIVNDVLNESIARLLSVIRQAKVKFSPSDQGITGNKN